MIYNINVLNMCLYLSWIESTATNRVVRGSNPFRHTKRKSLSLPFFVPWIRPLATIRLIYLLNLHIYCDKPRVADLLRFLR